METITYNLKVDRKDSSAFYQKLALYTTKLIRNSHVHFDDLLLGYQKYVKQNGIEIIRNRDEYFLELLMIGVFWKTYNQNIRLGLGVYLKLFKLLFTVRRVSSKIKPIADATRGWLATFILSNRSDTNKTISIKNFNRLLNWMDCTNEFNEEVKRLRQWHAFFKRNNQKAASMLSNIVTFADEFAADANQVFSEQTAQVYSFLENNHPSYLFQENYFFAGRREVEYHLNMVGAEILNRTFAAKFRNTNRKAVLLPTCMAKSNKCKAIQNGNDLVCQHCDTDCNISRITKKLEVKGISAVLIPHSSKFTEWLKPYANQENTGLIGIACVLNLLKGGYEMKNLNIPSQCVFLDHCGCKKHWHQKGIPTDLNIVQLEKILSPAEIKENAFSD